MKKANLSCIRLIATIMIVTCHILQGLDLEAAFWVNLGVQIFFVLSGYLYSTKKVGNIKEFYKKRYIKIIVPYIIFALVIIDFNYYFGYMTINKFMILGDLLGFQYWVGTIRDIAHTWFISYILLCYLITPLLERIIKKESPKKAFLQLFLLTLFLQLFQSYGVININVSYIMLYMFGYFYGNVEDKIKNDFKITLVFLALVAILFPPRILVQYYNNAFLIKYLDYFNLSVGYFTSYHHAFCGIVLFLVMKNIFKNIKYNKLLEFSDKYSYYIYLVHQVFILYDYSLLFQTDYLIVNILLIIICTIASAILLEFITKKVLEIPKLIKNKKINQAKLGNV